MTKKERRDIVNILAYINNCCYNAYYSIFNIDSVRDNLVNIAESVSDLLKSLK